MAKKHSRELWLQARNMAKQGTPKQDIAIYLSVSYSRVTVWTRDIDQGKRQHDNKPKNCHEHYRRKTTSWAHVDFEPDPCKTPTHHLCGSREKLEVMRERAERGESIWHPHDCTEHIDPPDGKLNAGPPGIREIRPLLGREKNRE